MNNYIHVDNKPLIEVQCMHNYIDNEELSEVQCSGNYLYMYMYMTETVSNIDLYCSISVLQTRIA